MRARAFPSSMTGRVFWVIERRDDAYGDREAVDGRLTAREAQRLLHDLRRRDPKVIYSLARYIPALRPGAAK